MTDRRKQRGISFLGVLMAMVVLAVAALVVAEIVPTALEYQAVQRAVVKARNAGATPADVRSLFDRHAQVDNVTSISGKDLEIGREAEGMVVRFAYERQIHLVGPAYLLLKYSGKAS